MTTVAIGVVQNKDFVGLSNLRKVCDAAREIAQIDFEPYVATSHEDLAEDLIAGDVGIAWMPPIFAANLIEQHLATPLALPVRAGRTVYHAAMIGRKGGPKSIAEMKGLRVGWVAADSASGYLLPRTHIAAQGHEVATFFAREQFYQGHRAVIDAVTRGEVDVGATRCHLNADGTLMRGSWTGADGQSARPVVLVQAVGPIPNDTLIAGAALPATTRAMLTRWLLALPPAAKAMFEALFDTSEFRPAEPGHYDALHHVVRAARARGYDALPRPSRSAFRVR